MPRKAALSSGNVLLPCIVTDVSESGARIKLLETAELPRDPLLLQSARHGVVARARSPPALS